MNDHYCRFCGLYLFSAIGKEGKVRITCRRCKRSQVVDVRQTGSMTHLQAAGMQ